MIQQARVLVVWVSLLLGLSACRQQIQQAPLARVVTPTFADLLRRFEQRMPSDKLLPLPIIYRDSTYVDNRNTRKLQYEIILAAQPLGLQHRVVQLPGRGYPVSYSVVFEGCLVALFKNGKFGCYRLADLISDEQLERQLNSGGWERCWLIGGKLVAQNSKGYYAYDPLGHAWQPYEARVPFGKQPKLFEDARYLAYATCNGEFGGNVYFYNKETGRTHHANATCANSIWWEGGQYRVLASLGHMIGFARCLAIADPEQLPPAPTYAHKSLWQYDSIAPSRQVVAPIFDFSSLQLFGAWRWHDQTHYLMHRRRTTFLVSIDGKQITIIDPLFADDLYTHNPVTSAYGPDLALTNLDGDDQENSEVALLLWQGQQVTKVEWSKQPDTLH